MSRRAAAEATLAGQVNDWPSTARQHARDVVELCVESEAAAAVHGREIEALKENLAALEARIAATVMAAEAAVEALARLKADRGEVVTRLAGVTTAALNLNARIVERSDNAFVFAYGSRGVIESFRKTIGV